MKTVSKVETLKTQTFENDLNAKNENEFLLNRYLSIYVKTTLTVGVLSLSMSYFKVTRLSFRSALSVLSAIFIKIN